MNPLERLVRARKNFVLSIGFLVVFAVTVSYATPPGSPFSPGTTLDPGCAPGESNCTVAVSSGGGLPTDGTILLRDANADNTVVPNLGAGTRLMWYPSKGAFRAGTVDGTQWDNANIGGHSVAFGENTTASESDATAFGNGTVASGASSLSIGNNTLASGTYSFAGGSGAQATEANTFAFGDTATASASSAVAFGANTIASAFGSMAFGNSSTASATFSIVMGYQNTSSGFASFSANEDNTASGTFSAAFGEGNEATQFTSASFGDSNHSIAQNSFTFGSGNTASGSFSTAFGLGTHSTDYFTTAFGNNSTASNLAATAFGQNTVASGQRSTAFGDTTHATGTSSTAFGSNTTASFLNATAFGENTTASGESSLATGQQTTAAYLASTAMGHGTVTGSNYSVAMGQYNEGLSDTALEVGIGANSGARTNGFAVDTNGNTLTYGKTTSSSLEIGGHVGTSDVVTGNATNLQATIIYDTDTTLGYNGYLADGSHTQINYKVYAYTIVDGKRVYSSQPATLSSDLSDDSSGFYYAVDLTWDAVPGADGYRVLLSDGGAYDRNLDTLTNHVVDDGCTTVCANYNSDVSFNLINTNTYSATLKGGVSVKGAASFSDSMLATGVVGIGSAVPDLGAGTRMMWFPSVAAFRAGTVDADQWDSAHVGQYSAAFGYDTTASGQFSTAFGQGSVASGDSSLSLNGYATGYGSVAFGSTASGDYSAAFGSSTASGQYTTSFGYISEAHAFGSAAFGRYNVGGGNPNSWIGTDSLFEIGNGTDGTHLSNALKVQKNGDLTIGGNIHVKGTLICDTSSPCSQGFWSSINSTNIMYPEFATVGSSDTPAVAQFSVVGFGSIVARGAFGTGSGVGADIPNFAGTRLQWYPKKSSFRAGTTTSTQWNSVNVGDYSTAFGYNTKASGTISTAFGGNSVASGDTSTAFGSNTVADGDVATAFGSSTVASGQNATAFGLSTVASGEESTAFGSSTIASGIYSAAFGYTTTATAGFSTVLGAMNVGGGTVDDWIATDPLFELGNGFSLGTPSDALMVLKNGYTGIGLDSAAPYPTVMLQVGSSALASGNVAHFENVDGTCDLDPTNTGGLSCTSDMNAKKNISLIADNSPWAFTNNITVDNQSVLAKVLALKPVQYNFKSESDTEQKHAGLIAQDVEQVFPELVNTDAKGKKTLNYSGLIPYQIQAIKEMNLNISDIGNVTRPNTWRDSLIAWFGSATNGIKSLVVRDKVCVDDQCLTKDDIRGLLQMERQQGIQTGGGVPAPVQSPEVTPPAPDVSVPAADPVPETPAPAPEEIQS